MNFVRNYFPYVNKDISQDAIDERSMLSVEVESVQGWSNVG